MSWTGTSTNGRGIELANIAYWSNQGAAQGQSGLKAPGRAHYAIDDPVALKNVERDLIDKVATLRRAGASADEIDDAELGLSFVRQALGEDDG